MFSDGFAIMLLFCSLLLSKCNLLPVVDVFDLFILFMQRERSNNYGSPNGAMENILD